jgi:hypothetical protein
MINTRQSQALLTRLKSIFSYNSPDRELLKKGLSVELVYSR